MNEAAESERIDVQMPVAGMTCQACANSIEAAARGIDGVLDAQASFGARSLHVTIDPERVTRQQLMRRVAEVLGPLGYRVPETCGEASSLAGDVEFEIASDRSERKRVRRELVSAFVLGLATSAALHFEWPGWIAVVLSGGVVFGACRRIVLTGFRTLLRGSPDMNTLVGLGLCTAWIAAFTSFVAPRLLAHGEHYLFDAVLIAVIVQIDGRLAGAFGLVDEPRPTSAAAIRALRDLGLEVLVLSGDRRAAVERLRTTLALDRTVPELSPEGKVLELSTLREAGRRVAMVGDGMNDAPALAAAYTGLAFGGGADVAVLAAGTTILRDDPEAVSAAVRLARATVRTIRQNLAWAFAYNLFAIPVATGMLDRVLGGALPSGAAGAAMSLSSLAVVLNSLRLRKNC